MTSFAVRPAESDDAPAIRRVARESWHAAYDDIIGADTVDETIDQWYDTEHLRESATNPDHEFFVAEREEIVGIVHAAPSSDENGVFRLLRIYVVSDEWGLGLGSRLLSRVEERLRERDSETLRLTVLADNDVGVGFYESRDFERVEEGEAEGFGAGEYVYEKTL
ncbi:Ribosomal protein S18 acetylase RimI [Haladaptatus litoreus]|uniref:Ribosomal protein S18 acetylase RimI n=1 Tax=Haladaptatus litoreus TaxID=553468 RepID=A0A1N6VRN4_9EURY|nr:GNAT family N-acetyltransferase [Haladaptatus litoreus]SIQ80532.1 Ribosomal protein S18 acetylase RimI [Haladaptatus litoreus]